MIRMRRERLRLRGGRCHGVQPSFWGHVGFGRTAAAARFAAPPSEDRGLSKWRLCVARRVQTGLNVDELFLTAVKLAYQSKVPDMRCKWQQLKATKRGKG